MELSRRLASVAGLVSKGNRLADIGTDHGYIPIHLVSEGICPSAIAMDVNAGPLERADAHIREQNLTDRISTRLSNGLQKLNADEADSIVIAGMGGALMETILTEGMHVISEGKELILQPQSEIFKVRHFLHQNGYEIVREIILEEDGKYYFIIKALPGEQSFPEEFLYEHGEYLLKEKNPLMMKYLEKQIEKYQAILNQLSLGNPEERKEAVNQRIEEIKSHMNHLERAYHYEG